MKHENQATRTLLGAAPRMVPIVAPALAAAALLRIVAPGFSAMAPRFRAVELALAVTLASFGAVFWASATRRLLASWRRHELATGGAFALTRHPIFSWWLWSVLPSLALALDAWPFLAVIPVFYLAARRGAALEEAELLSLFGADYETYRRKTNRLWPFPTLRGAGLRGVLRWAAFCAAVGLGSIALYFAAARPLVLNMGMARAGLAVGREAAWAGDELIPDPRQGFSQAYSYPVSAEELWPWLVQVGYGRAGWYNVDAINSLAGPDYFYEGGGSARRIIPELQSLAAGDSVAIVPAQAFTVLELVPARRLLLAGGLPKRPDGGYAPAPAREGFAVTWLFELLPTGPDSCLLVSRFRTDFGGGLGMGLIFGVVNELGGAMLQQPAMFYGLKERAAGPERKTDDR